MRRGRKARDLRKVKMARCGKGKEKGGSRICHRDGDDNMEDNMSDQIEFKVGNEYENRKGLFEVISIKSDSMIIQWENGEKISTDIELQQRIIEDMEIERQQSKRLEPKDNINRKKNHRRTSHSGKL